jgi:hypothetical protein
MTNELQRSSMVAAAFPAGHSRPADARTVLVAVATFEWLRQLQARAPLPRVDMRYLLEGALATLAANAELQAAWLDAAADSLATHMQRARTEAVAARSTVVGTANPRIDRRIGEGAHARTSGALASSGRRHDDCRALQIGESTFRCLRDLQGKTYEPRLDFRFLLTGAHELLAQRPLLLPEVIERARAALREHLAELAAIPVPPFSMEIQA